MIWWRGNGLLLLFLGCVPAYAAMKLGAAHPAFAYFVSAVLIFFLRDMIGEDAAFMSIRTKFWPPLLFIVGLLVQFSPPREVKATPVQKAAAEAQAGLPRKLNDMVRLDGASFDGAALHYDGSVTSGFDSHKALDDAIDRDMQKLYCEELKPLSQAGISLTLIVSVPPRTMSERLTTRTQNYAPAQCR
jgi:hypothetical protein